jgi:acetyltransferase-like isoleucine patch superfamily enzyme
MDGTAPDSAALRIHPTASVSPDARLHPSVRGTRIEIGAHSFIYDFVVIRAVGGSGNVVIGEHCYINPHTVIYSGHGVRLGNYVLVGPGCVIAPANHAHGRRDIPIRHQGFMPSRGGVVIEDDVWVGANATLLDGAHIGTGAIIAAGAVVNGRVEPHAIYGGVPARKIGEREGS